MDYCGPLGLPRSTFLGWDSDDRHAAIVWQLHRAAVHPPCGTRPEEWDPDRGGHEHAYMAEIRACRGCETLASGQKQLPKALERLGGHIVLVRNPEART